MDKLAEAKELSGRADNYEKEGNYEYAMQCYDKIIMLLKATLK